MEYIICESDSPYSLEKQVTTLLNDGWKVIGIPFTNQGVICQAMLNDEVATIEDA